MKKSWKTTAGGYLSAIGLSLVAAKDQCPGENGPEIVGFIGLLVAGAGNILLGTSARDNNVSSEDAGIKKT